MTLLLPQMFVRKSPERLSRTARLLSRYDFLMKGSDAPHRHAHVLACVRMSRRMSHSSNPVCRSALGLALRWRRQFDWHVRRCAHNTRTSVRVIMTAQSFQYQKEFLGKHFRPHCSASAYWSWLGGTEFNHLVAISG